MILQEKLNESFFKFKDSTAIELGSESLTYGELDRKSNYTANLLLDKGIKKESFIGVLLEDRKEVIAAIIGILKAGCVFVPLDPMYPADRLKSMIDTADIELIFTDKINSRLFESNKEIEMSGCEFLIIDTMVSTENHSWFHSVPEMEYTPEDKIYIYFTSGTTGTPKALVGKNKSLTHFINWEVETFNIDEGFRVSQLITPVFDAFLRDIFVPLFSGGTICIPESKNIMLKESELKEWIDCVKINLVHCVPNVLRLLTSKPVTNDNFKSLKLALISGEKINPPDIANWYSVFNDGDIKLVNLWGTSETTLAKTYYIINKDDVNRETIPVGKPIRGARVIALDENMNICNELEIGELYIRTPFRTFGYYNDPELNKQRFIQNPFNDAPGDLIHKTGDLGRFSPDGNIEVLGRIDRQVKIRGIRVELEEIESIFIKHPLVKEAAVIKKEISRDNECLYAYVTEKETITTDKASLLTALKEYVSKKLPGYMIPANIAILEEMPRNPTGKIDYKGLPDPFVNEGKGFISPRNDIENKLAELWAEILGINKKKISVTKGFFELGGNSLNIMKLISNIHKEFDTRLTLAEIFNNATIEKQMGIIKESRQVKYASIEVTEEKEYYALSSAQKRVYIQHQVAREQTNYNIPLMVELEGIIDRDSLQEIFNELIKRHESFRTSFEIVAAEPVQKVQRDMKFEIEFYHPTGSAEELIDGFVRPFDLSRAPLLRIGLIQGNPEDKHLLMVDMHHIISDAVSFMVFIDEFMSLYEGEQVQPLKIQYKDFAQWQNRLLSSGEIKKQEKYWSERFSGDIPVLELPIDYPRPPVQRFEGQTITSEINETLTEKVRAIANKQEATLYMVLLAIYTILLSKYTGQKDIIVGSPVAGRRHTDLDSIVGMFINVLLMRNSPGDGKSFEEYLGDVKNNTLQAFDNQDYPFDHLYPKLNLKREGGRNPLYEVIFALHNEENEKLEIPGLKLTSREYKNPTMKTELRLGVEERDNKVVMFLTYSTVLFARETAEGLLRHYKEILEQVVTDEKIKLENIKITHDFETLKSNELWTDESEFNL